jgi:hypothetical protein
VQALAASLSARAPADLLNQASFVRMVQGDVDPQRAARSMLGLFEHLAGDITQACKPHCLLYSTVHFAIRAQFCHSSVLPLCPYRSRNIDIQVFMS